MEDNTLNKIISKIVGGPERTEGKDLITPLPNGKHPVLYAICNDSYISYPKLNCLMALDPDEKIPTSYKVINNYPNIDELKSNSERKSKIREHFIKSGLLENIDFKFVSMPQMAQAEKYLTENNRSTEEPDKYKVLGQKIEEGIATAEDVKKFNSLQEEQLKENIKEVKETTTALASTELTR